MKARQKGKQNAKRKLEAEYIALAQKIIEAGKERIMRYYEKLAKQSKSNTEEAQ